MPENINIALELLEDETLESLQESIAVGLNYQSVLESGHDNPETKAEFFNRMMSTMLRKQINDVSGIARWKAFQENEEKVKVNKKAVK